VVDGAKTPVLIGTTAYFEPIYGSKSQKGQKNQLT
jgi:hypothetical protein